LKALISRYSPAVFSEHLAWSTHQGRFLNDLLPIAYTGETLRRVAEHVDEVQSALGRRILLENPSTYVTFTESEWSEPEFIAEVVRRSGCALLLDVNNVFVSATNHQWNPRRYIDDLPLREVREIHLAGHASDVDDGGRPLLIDAHDRRVASPVWDLYQHTIGLTGPQPTLIEWDANVPDWAVLEAEAHHADQILGASTEVRRALG
jgi:uncharacterized protein (UPF0276 family)